MNDILFIEWVVDLPDHIWRSRVEMMIDSGCKITIVSVGDIKTLFNNGGIRECRFVSLTMPAEDATVARLAFPDVMKEMRISHIPKSLKDKYRS